MEFNPNSLILLGVPRHQINKNTSGIGMPQPDYSAFDFCTKTDPTMSEDEYEQAIREQARKDAFSGAGYEGSATTRALIKEYVSVASPDRRTIISSAIRKFSHSSTKNQLVTYASFKDSQGREVASYSGNGGWAAIGTSEEFARQYKFSTIYRQAYLQAYSEKPGSLDTSI